jgi:hypothetical protein
MLSNSPKKEGISLPATKYYMDVSGFIFLFPWINLLAHIQADPAGMPNLVSNKSAKDQKPSIITYCQRRYKQLDIDVLILYRLK